MLRHHFWSVRLNLPFLILSIRFVFPSREENSVSACVRSSAHIGHMTTTFNVALRTQESKVPRGFELRSLDSESRVLTVTPWDQLCPYELTSIRTKNDQDCLLTS